VQTGMIGAPGKCSRHGGLGWRSLTIKNYF
jgi:hypothetical protein